MNLLAHRQSNPDLLEYSKYAEINRIIDIPIEPEFTIGMVESLSKLYINADAYKEGYRLLRDQARAVLAFNEIRGAFCPIAVGGGKTLVSLILTNDALTKMGLRKVLLVIPPTLVDQLVRIDIPAYRRKTPITYPISILAGRTQEKRKEIAESGKKGLYVLPYSLLQTKDTVDILNTIAPDMIILDEAHHVCRKSARTTRIRNYISLHNPLVIAMSGTITKKSPNDYAFMARAALKDCNFMPNALSLATEWSAVIGANVATLDEYRLAGIKRPNPGPILPLVNWAKENFPEERFDRNLTGFRKAYKMRMMTCKGTVCSGDNELGVSLVIRTNPVIDKESSEGWDELDRLAKQVMDEGLTPNGDEIEHAMHSWKWLYEIYGGGFYNELKWPGVAEYAERKSITEIEAEYILERALVHHEAGQVYACLLRKFLNNHSAPHLDTPMLVGKSLYDHKDQYVPTRLYKAWKDWKDLDFEARPDRDSFAVRVCPYKVDQGIDWAMNLPAVNREQGFPEETGGIIWYHHQAVGQWLHEKLAERGCDRVLFCPAGAVGNKRIIKPENWNKIAIASILAHREGKNLQHFKNQWFVQFPRPATMAEQVMGRSHRTGQDADELIVNLNLTVPFDHITFSATLNDSAYIHQTTGNRQKLIYASYDPVPKRVPREVLIEWGTDPYALTREAEQELIDKFDE